MLQYNPGLLSTMPTISSYLPKQQVKAKLQHIQDATVIEHV